MEIGRFWGVVLFLLGQAASADPGLPYHYFFQGKKIEVSLTEQGGALVNEVCEKKEKCSALKAWNGKNKIEKIEGSDSGNYAGKYCELLGATQAVLTAKKEKSIFCLFSDLSLIEAKSLYEKHYGLWQKGKGL